MTTRENMNAKFNADMADIEHQYEVQIEETMKNARLKYEAQGADSETIEAHLSKQRKKLEGEAAADVAQKRKEGTTRIEGLTKGERQGPKPQPVWVCVLKCIFSPCLLVWLSCIIYCLPCLGAYLGRCFCAFCCAVCRCCRDCCHHRDKKFPPEGSSLGQLEAISADQIEWHTADEITQNETHLFSLDIKPTDVAQGMLGDCWLLTAFASLAEYPGRIQRVFVNKERSNVGKYTMRLFDRRQGEDGKWMKISVDDRFPCRKGSTQPIFAQPKDNEIWVLLLEKAFAKFCGGYDQIEGGISLWALEAMTGDIVMRWARQNNGGFQRENMAAMAVAPGKKGGPKAGIGLRPTDEILDEREMFQTLEQYDKKDCVIAASSNGNSDKEEVEGIVQGHAYTLKRVVDCNGTRLVQLRNPWGKGEWTGDWSDKSPLWQSQGDVRRKCGKDVNDENDGLFWMAWEDFVRHYKAIDICASHRGIEDLALDLNEEQGCCGPLRGCVGGCCTFWFCCAGCKAVCCSRKTSTATLRI